jgi:large conductance mechanosensitive channel
MLKGFRDFLLRGNVIDLAVAVVVGAAFTAVVNSIVTAVINPAIGALFNADDLKTALPVDLPTVSGGTATLYFGAVVAAVIQFVLVAVVVYFALVLPVNALRKHADVKRATGDEQTPPNELDLLTEIRDLLAADAAEGPRTT